MFRRSFFGRALAAVAAGAAALVGLPGKADALPAAPAFDPTVPDRNPHDGGALAWLYRVADDGKAYRIDRGTAKAGDRLIMLGLSGDRLFKAQAFTAADWPNYVGEDGTAGVVADPEATQIDLLTRAVIRPGPTLVDLLDG